MLSGVGCSARIVVGGKPCPITATASTTLTCTLPSGSANNVTVVVSICRQQVQFLTVFAVFTRNVVQFTTTLGYATPTITAGTLMLYPSSAPAGTVTLSSMSGGVDVVFNGNGFGTVPAQLTVLYGVKGSPPAQRFACNIVTLTNTQVRCTTTAGYGAGLVFVVLAQGASSPDGKVSSLLASCGKQAF